MGRLLPSGERGDEGGGSVDLAGSNGMCGGGLREVEARWRDCSHEGKNRLNSSRSDLKS